MVSAGSTLTFDVKGTAGQWLPRTAAEVRAQVVDALTLQFHVYNVAMERETFLSDPENLYYWNWPYTAVVTVQTRVGYGSVDHAAAIVANAFYQGAGTMPTVTARGSGPQQDPDVEIGPSLFSLGALVILGALLWVFGPTIRAAVKR